MSSGIIPDTLGALTGEPVDEPHLILEKLSDDIERVTERDVLGEIRPEGAGNGWLRVYFDLFAPGVPYTYPLFSLRYRMADGFPVEFIDHRTDPVSTKDCPDRGALEAELRTLFRSDSVDRIVHQLRQLTITARRQHKTYSSEFDY